MVTNPERLFDSTKPSICNENGVVPSNKTPVSNRIGWTEIGSVPIPYIIRRSGRRYVAEDTANFLLFYPFHQTFSSNMSVFLKSPKLPITKTEASLLNEINVSRSDISYVPVVFQETHKVMPLDDIIEMYKFFCFCYKKLIKKDMTNGPRCGFIRVGSGNSVAFVNLKGIKHVPLFYFDGECAYLQQRSTNVSGWDLAYLQFACEVQGVGRKLTLCRNIQVVQLDLVKQVFPSGTTFEDVWLADSSADHLIYISKPVAYTKMTSNTATTKLRTESEECQRKLVSGSSLHVSSVNQVTQNPALKLNGQRSDDSLSSIRNRLTTNMTEKTNVPPIQSSPDMVGRPFSMEHANPNVPDISTTMANPQVQVGPRNSFPEKERNFYSFPEAEPANAPPYFLRKIQIEKRLFFACINMEVYNPNIMLVTLEELAACWFCVPIDVVVKAANTMNLQIYLPNSDQLKVFHSVGIRRISGLVKTDTLAENFRLFGTILALARTHSEQNRVETVIVT